MNLFPGQQKVKPQFGPEGKESEQFWSAVQGFVYLGGKVLVTSDKPFGRYWKENLDVLLTLRSLSLNIEVPGWKTSCLLLRSGRKTLVAEIYQVEP